MPDPADGAYTDPERAGAMTDASLSGALTDVVAPAANHGASRRGSGTAPVNAYRHSTPVVNSARGRGNKWR